MMQLRSENAAVRVSAGVLEGLEGEVMASEADELMIALSNSPGVYIVVESRFVQPVGCVTTAEAWR